mmetsp:Transcript_28375/g.60500  ORF Transcript_28375/g.60500 Transcript_28375/m.60500 type:complete len:471 (-) Transcript_28375:67-1479(-)
MAGNSPAFAVPSLPSWADFDSSQVASRRLTDPLESVLEGGGSASSFRPTQVCASPLAAAALAFTAAALFSGRRRGTKHGRRGARTSSITRNFANQEAGAAESAEDLSFASFASEARQRVQEASSGLLSSIYDAADSTLSRSPQTEEAPSSIFSLAAQAMRREATHLAASCENTPFEGVSSAIRWVTGVPPNVSIESPFQEPPPAVKALTLSSSGVADREEERGTPSTPMLIWILFRTLSWALDILYEGRPIARLWALETIARIPYFAFGTALQLYESLGWWRTPNLRDVHHAEEANELHHLLIMEALGGNAKAFDRFFAHNAAVLYYWATVALYMVSPTWAYNFSHLVEEHAYVTYSQFVAENEERLRRLPPPPVAQTYYRDGDLYQFDKFHTQLGPELPPRRPPCDNLLDVFRNVRDDEAEHIATIAALEEWTGGDPAASICGDEETRAAAREAWLEWSREINSAPALS